MSTDPATMTPAQINRELDALDRRDRELTDRMIATGRGWERPSETRTKRDPLSREIGEVADRKAALRAEIDARYGPGAPTRLPTGRGFGPRKRA